MMFFETRKTREDIEGATALGVASIGIGLLELCAPRFVQHLLGLDDRAHRRRIVQVLGVRELMHGVSILTEDRSKAKLASNVWARVAGDVLDTAVLGIAATKTRHPARFAAVSAAVMGIGALDVLFASRLSAG